jgi:hypothetical protein
MLARFREWGWQARIETYDVLFPTPKDRLLEMIAPTRFKAPLEEPAMAEDPTSGQKSEQLPTYNIYSIDGEVTGPLVYVNYGRPEDYEELEARGVSVRGAIVIARYGGSFRGTKPKIAAGHGAIGCVIYSDPRDDGYYGDAVFPEGPMRNKDGVQTYRLGPGASQVHLKVSSTWEVKTIYDVIATMPGSTFPDEWIVRGNHHDAGVNGASDPISGMAPELEEARALGLLAKQGWRPKRTIVYAAWDGEEAALLGSTEWVEQHEDELRQKAVAYINTDGNSRGFLQAGGSHTLEHFINEVARSVIDPETNGTVWKRWQANRIANGTADARAEARTRADLRIGALGSGVRLHAVTAAPRHRSAEPVLRGTRRGRDLPLDLRRLLSLPEILRSRVSLRARAGTVRRNGGHPARGRRSPALLIHRARGHRANLRSRTSEPA